MSVTAMNGSTLVSNHTLANLIQACMPRQLDSSSTLFDVGVESNKAATARLIQKEFNLDVGLNPAAAMLRRLRNDE